MRRKWVLLGLGAVLLTFLSITSNRLPFFRGDVRYSDSVTAHWPSAVFFRHSLQLHGEFPLWRETTMAGQPFAANPLNKTAYPLQWLILQPIVISSAPTFHLNLLIVLHLLIAGSGMWLWARSLELRVEAALLSAIAYVFAPRMMGHLGAGHLDVIYAMAWWPWLMLSVKSVVRGGWHAVLQVSLVTALLLLADVRVSLFAFTMAGAYVLIEVRRIGAWRRIWRFVLAGILFLLLTASLIVPLLLWQPYMSRTDLTVADAGILSINPAHFLGVILPSPPPGIETLTYFGFPVLALALLALIAVGKRRRLVLFAIVLFVVLYTLGANGLLWPSLVKLIPALLWFRVPARAWLMLAFLVPVAAGYGLQWLLNHIDEWRIGELIVTKTLKLSVTASIAVAVGFGFFALVLLHLPPDIGLTTLIGGVTVGGVLLAALNGRLTTRQISILFIALTILDLGANAYRWVEWRGSDQWLDPQRPLAQRLVELQADRIYSPTYSLEQQTAEEYNLRLFGGVDPFQLTGVVDAIEQASGVNSDQYSVVLPAVVGADGDDLSQANREAAINTEILAEWKVSHVVAAYEINNPHLEFVDNINGISIYKNLDYQLSTLPDRIPDWPSGWPDLPDESTVTRFNQITVTVAVFSGIVFFISIFLLILTQLRHKRV